MTNKYNFVCRCCMLCTLASTRDYLIFDSPFFLGVIEVLNILWWVGVH